MSYFFYINVKEAKNNDFLMQTLISHGFYDARVLKEKEVRKIFSDIKTGTLVRIALWLPDYCSEYLSVINKMRQKYKAIYILKYWEGKGRSDRMFPTETIKGDDLSIKILSEINGDTFYRIEFFKRYFDIF